MNTLSERLKAWNFFICQYFSFYEQLKFRAQLTWAQKSFKTLDPVGVVDSLSNVAPIVCWSLFWVLVLYCIAALGNNSVLVLKSSRCGI